MKTYIKATALSLVLALNISSAKAQNTATGYFTEGNLYRHEMNPALDNEQGYVAIPVLGNVTTTMRSNLAVDNIFFVRNGHMTTLLNPNVSVSDVMSGINDNNRVSADIKMQLIGGGFKKWGGYNTIGINVRANVSAKIPGTLFEMAKEGLTNKTYNIEDMKGHGDAYAEIALGHSRKINEKWKVGGKLKVLLGLGNVDVYADHANIQLGEDGYVIDAKARVETSIKNFVYLEKAKDPKTSQGNTKYVNDFEIGKKTINGIGLGLDLGAEYTFDDNWKFSLALLDFGFLHWNNNILAESNSSVINTNDYRFNVDDEAEHAFEKEMDLLTDNLAKIYELQNKGDQGGKTNMLAATINAGAQYKLPQYDKLTIGLLNTTRLHGAYTWTDFRLSANWAACNIFALSGSFNAGSYGMGLGLLANLHAKHFNMFFGMDHINVSYAKQGIPKSGNASFTAGINVPL